MYLYNIIYLLTYLNKKRKSIYIAEIMYGSISRANRFDFRKQLNKVICAHNHTYKIYIIYYMCVFVSNGNRTT